MLTPDTYYNLPVNTVENNVKDGKRIETKGVSNNIDPEPPLNWTPTDLSNPVKKANNFKPTTIVKT